MQSSSKTMPPASPACKSARHARTCAANAPCKALLRSKLMRPEFQCATMCAGTLLGQTPSMTLDLAHKPSFDKRDSPVLSRNEITKYVTHKPGGGCEASAHLGKHDKSVDMGRRASMPGGPQDLGPRDPRLMTLKRLQGLMVTANILLLTLPFAWLCCCTQKLPRAMPGHNLPPRQFVHCGCDQPNRFYGQPQLQHKRIVRADPG